MTKTMTEAVKARVDAIHAKWDEADQADRIADQAVRSADDRLRDSAIFLHSEVLSGVRKSDIARPGRMNDAVAQYNLTGQILTMPGEVAIPEDYDKGEAHYVRYIVQACANDGNVRLKGITNALKDVTDRGEAVAALVALLGVKVKKEKTPAEKMDTALGMWERAIAQVRAAMGDVALTDEQIARVIAAATDGMALAGSVTAAPVTVAA